MKEQILKEYSRFALKDFYEEQGWNTTPSLDWLEKSLDKMIKEENKAWLEGKRCTNCGRAKERDPLSDTCIPCWEDA